MKTVKTLGIITLVCAIVLVSVSCAGINGLKLLGTWTNTTSALGIISVDTSFTFNSDGTGKMEGVLGINADFTYTTDGDKLEIKYEVAGISATLSYIYSISGKELTLVSDIDNSSTVYVKQ